MYKDSTEDSKLAYHENDLQNDVEKLKTIFLDTTRDARAMINQSLEDAKVKTSAVQEDVSQYIAEKPFKAVGIALLAGWFVGMWMRRKRR